MGRNLLLAIVIGSFVFASVAAAADTDYSNHPVNAWIKQSPRPGADSPRFQWEGAGAYDPANDVWIHYGGHDHGPQGFATFLFNMKTGAWTQQFPNTSPAGVCCVDGADTFDTANQRFVRFPGASMGHGWQWSRNVSLKDSAAWLYDAAANHWTNMRPAPYGEPAKYSRNILGSLDGNGTYDALHEVAISFGGQTGGGDTNALHAYDAYSNKLTQLRKDQKPDAAPEPVPAQRDGCGIAYDSDNDCLVVFGSQYANDEKTWIYRYATNKWEGLDLNPRPCGLKDRNGRTGTYSTIPKMVYDSINKVIVCVVWLGDRQGHETWALDVAKKQWTNMKPASVTDNTRSRTRNIDFDARRNLVILEIESNQGNVPQIWTYRYKAAPKSAAPAAVNSLTLTTDVGKPALSGAEGANLAWQPVAGAKSYNVYRAIAEDTIKAKFEKLANVNGTSFENPLPAGELKAGQIGFYRVKAVGADGAEGPLGNIARTQPQVLLEPVASVLGQDKVEVAWKAHPAKDVVGYNVYRGEVKIRSTLGGGEGGKWSDNNPKCGQPTIVAVRDIQRIVKLNDQPIAAASFLDARADLGKAVEFPEPRPEPPPAPKKKSADDGEKRGAPEPNVPYNFGVYAYIVTAVNKLGVESGPSPYVLTIPSAVTHVMLRESADGAEIKWSASPEKGIAGYLVFKMPDQFAAVELVTSKPIQGTAFTAPKPAGGKARYYVVAVDALGQQGEPSSSAWYGASYQGFFAGDWHQ